MSSSITAPPPALGGARGPIGNAQCVDCPPPDPPPGPQPPPPIPQFRKVCNSVGCIEGETYESKIPPLLNVYHAKGSSTRQDEGGYHRTAYFCGPVLCFSSVGSNALSVTIQVYGQHPGSPTPIWATTAGAFCNNCETADWKIYEVSVIVSVTGSGLLPVTVSGLPSYFAVDDIKGMCATNQDTNKAFNTAWGAYIPYCGH